MFSHLSPYIPPTGFLNEDLFKRLDSTNFILIGDLNAKINKKKNKNSIGNQLLDFLENSTSAHLYYNNSPTFYSSKMTNGNHCLYEETLDKKPSKDKIKQ